MWNLISPTWDKTYMSLYNGRQVLNHCTTREVSACLICQYPSILWAFVLKSKYIAWELERKNIENLTVMSCPYGWVYIVNYLFTPGNSAEWRHCYQLQNEKLRHKGEASCQTCRHAKVGFEPRWRLRIPTRHPVTTHGVSAVMGDFITCCRWGYGDWPDL